MAFNKDEMSVMASTGVGDSGGRFFWYTNSAGDTVSTSGFFLDYFKNKEVPTANASGVGASGDIIYDAYGQALYALTLDDNANPTTATVTAL